MKQMLESVIWKTRQKTPNQSNKKKEKFKNEDSLRYLWDNMKNNNIHIIGVSEKEEREQGIKKLSEEIMTEYISHLVKEKDTQVWEVKRVPNKITPKRPTPTHIKSKTGNG